MSQSTSKSDPEEALVPGDAADRAAADPASGRRRRDVRSVYAYLILQGRSNYIGFDGRCVLALPHDERRVGETVLCYSPEPVGADHDEAPQPGTGTRLPPKRVTTKGLSVWIVDGRPGEAVNRKAALASFMRSVEVPAHVTFSNKAVRDAPEAVAECLVGLARGQVIWAKPSDPHRDLTTLFGLDRTEGRPTSDRPDREAHADVGGRTTRSGP